MAARYFLLISLICLTPAVVAKTYRVSAGPKAETQLLTALAHASSGEAIVLGAGNFSLSTSLKLGKAGVTLRGAGPDQTQLSFAHLPQTTSNLMANAGIILAADQLQVSDLAIVDAKGPAIGGTVFGTEPVPPLIIDNITLKNLLLDGNQIRLTTAHHVLFDTITARNTFSGIQTTNSEYVVVRNCVFEHDNVGLEVENDYFADIYDNVARNNVGGIMLLDMPMYTHLNGHSIRVFRNKILDNNMPSKIPNGIAATMRSGTGILIMGGESDIHIFDNEISGNGHANITIVALPWQIDKPEFNAVPNDIVIRNNRFGPSGFAALDNLAAVRAAGGSLADVIWDGATTFIAAGQVKHSPTLRLTLSNNVREDGMPVRYLSLGLTIADGGMLVANPTSTLPEAARSPEPMAVQLSQDNAASARRRISTHLPAPRS